MLRCRKQVSGKNFNKEYLKSEVIADENRKGKKMKKVFPGIDYQGRLSY